MLNQNRFGKVHFLLVILLFIGLMASVFASTPSAHAAGYASAYIQWPQNISTTPVPLVQGNEDFIKISRRADMPGNMLKVVLNTPSYMTWWKDIELVVLDNKTNPERILASAYTQDNFHQATFYAVIDNTNYGAAIILRLSKAKMFGVHTSMYQLMLTQGFSPELKPSFQLGGSTITFDWIGD